MEFRTVASDLACRNLCCEKGCLGLSFVSASKECRLSSTRIDGEVNTDPAIANQVGSLYQERLECSFYGEHEGKIWRGNNDITDAFGKHPKADDLAGCKTLFVDTTVLHLNLQNCPTNAA